jgi:hypothetical protein
LFDLYEDFFSSVAVNKGISNGIPQQIMDEVSVEAMLSEAGVNWTSGRIIFCHLKQYFGISIIVSEKKRQAYFEGNDVHPSVDRTILPDKTIVSYWWKHPDKLLQHQINYVVKVEDLQGLQSIVIATRGDHGDGRF